MNSRRFCTETSWVGNWATGWAEREAEKSRKQKEACMHSEGGQILLGILRELRGGLAGGGWVANSWWPLFKGTVTQNEEGKPEGIVVKAQRWVSAFREVEEFFLTRGTERMSMKGGLTTAVTFLTKARKGRRMKQGERGAQTGIQNDLWGLSGDQIQVWRQRSGTPAPEWKEMCLCPTRRYLLAPTNIRGVAVPLLMHKSFEKLCCDKRIERAGREF